MCFIIQRSKPSLYSGTYLTDSTGSGRNTSSFTLKFQARGALLPLTKVVFAEVFHDVIIIFIFVFAGITDLGCWKCKKQQPPSDPGRKEQQVALGTLWEMPKLSSPSPQSPLLHPRACSFTPEPPEHFVVPYPAADPLQGSRWAFKVTLQPKVFVLTGKKVQGDGASGCRAAPGPNPRPFL